MKQNIVESSLMSTELYNEHSESYNIESEIWRSGMNHHNEKGKIDKHEKL
jgi:hypothetical protein